MEKSKLSVQQNLLSLRSYKFADAQVDSTKFILTRVLPMYSGHRKTLFCKLLLALYSKIIMDNLHIGSSSNTNREVIDTILASELAPLHYSLI